MICLLNHSKEPERVWKLLEKVTISESNVGAQVELEGIKNKRKDNYTKAVCNYLEKYIDDCANQKLYDEGARSDYENDLETKNSQ